MNSPPFFEDFKRGQDLSQVPAVTITEGMTALYQGMFGDRSRVYLDQRLSERYTGSNRMLVNPLLVGHIAIGQSTICLLYTSPSPRDQRGSRMPSSA